MLSANHGCFWLENQGGWKFETRRIATFDSTYAVAPDDLDADGDEDVALVSQMNDWSDRTAGDPGKTAQML